MSAALVVDMAGFRVSSDPEASLVTYALGSCIAVTLHDPTRRAGGMIHYMLPLSSSNPERARQKPAMFADIGVPLLFEAVYALGCKKENLVVTVTGGAQVHDDNEVFAIGKRNYATLRKMFWKNNILISAEDVGGSISRTVWLDIATGAVRLRVQGQDTQLWPHHPEATAGGTR